MEAKLKKAVKCVAAPATIVVTLTVLLIFVVILQALISFTVSIFLLGSQFAAQQQILYEASKEEWRIPRAKKMFMANGDVHLLCGQEPYFYFTTYEAISIYDANDALLWTGDHDEIPYQYAINGVSFQQHEPEDRQPNLEDLQKIALTFSRTLVLPVFSPERTFIEGWQYKPGLSLFVGFRADGGKIGYLGSNGFAELKEQVEPFGTFVDLRAGCPAEAHNLVLLYLSQTQLHEINFEQRKVDLLFDAQGEEIYKFDLSNWYGLEDDKTQDKSETYLITKDGQCCLFLEAHQQQLTFRLPKDWFPYHANFAANENGIFLTYAGAEGTPVTDDKELWDKWWKQDQYKQHEEQVELYSIASNGSLKFLSRFEWIKPASPQRHVQWRQKQEKVIDELNKYLTAISSPLSFKLGYWLDYKQLSELAPAYPISNLSISLMMACIVLLHAWPRRTSWGRFVFWLVFVAAFNLAGFLTYLALNHATVIRCAACGKKRGLERGDCPSCGALLPIPERRETDLILLG